MKRIGILVWCLAILALSQGAYSYPAIRDRVRYEALFEGAVVVQEKEITHQSPEGEGFGVHSVTTYRGTIVEERRVELPRSFLYTPEKIAHVIKDCVRREGALSRMDVLGVSMSVCEFYNEDSQLSSILGPVPFGLIRFQVYIGDEDFLDFHLTARFDGGSQKGISQSLQ